MRSDQPVFKPSVASLKSVNHALNIHLARIVHGLDFHGQGNPVIENGGQFFRAADNILAPAGEKPYFTARREQHGVHIEHAQKLEMLRLELSELQQSAENLSGIRGIIQLVNQFSREFHPENRRENSGNQNLPDR